MKHPLELDVQVGVGLHGALWRAYWLPCTARVSGSDPVVILRITPIDEPQASEVGEADKDHSGVDEGQIADLLKSPASGSFFRSVAAEHQDK